MQTHRTRWEEVGRIEDLGKAYVLSYVTLDKPKRKFAMTSGQICALWQPRGERRGGKWEEVPEGGPYVYQQLIHVDMAETDTVL